MGVKSPTENSCLGNGMVNIVRRKRNKTKKVNRKLLIALTVCLSAVTATLVTNKNSEALAFSSLTQPINIMYSLLTKKNFVQFNEISQSTNYHFEPLYKYKSNLIDEKNKTQPEKQEIKIEGKEEAEKQNINSSNQTVNTVNSASTKLGTSNQKRQSEQKIIYLTFDDGPSAFTSQILETLKTYNMKATFFMLEPNMRTYQEELHAIINNGHTPALHGVTHNVSKIYRSEKTVVDEMAKAQATLMKITGTGTTLIRTPYGSAPYMKPSYKKAVKAAGFQLWDWTVDSEDWKYTNGEYVNRTINQIEHFRYKDRPIVILLHDRKSTAEYLPKLLTYLKKNGYTPALLNDQLTAFHF